VEAGDEGDVMIAMGPREQLNGKGEELNMERAQLMVRSVSPL
jgi:hypothetical protein